MLHKGHDLGIETLIRSGMLDCVSGRPHQAQRLESLLGWVASRRSATRLSKGDALGLGDGGHFSRLSFRAAVTTNFAISKTDAEV